jgi:carbon-monoxide dehydrogenase medium subunit
MKPPAFKYIVPESIEAALTILAEHGDDAKILAGGQSLIPTMNYRMVQPTLLMDINGLEELSYIQSNGDGEIKIGAMTRHKTMEHDPVIAENAQLLHETMPHISHPQIRNRGTMGGSLVHADPAAELPVIAMAMEAKVRVKSSAGEREIPAEDFFLGIFMTDIEPEEILLEVILPQLPQNTGWSFMEIARRSGDYAMMGIATLITIDESDKCTNAKLVYLNAGDGPVLATEAGEMLVGENKSTAVFEAVAEVAAVEEIDPLGSLHASEDYQRHLARVLTKRALGVAFDRAIENQSNRRGDER